MAVILITGGSGLLGLNWAIRRRHIDEVHLVLHKRAAIIGGVKHHYVDLLDEKAISDLLKELSTDIVVNTVGLTDVDECEKNPQKSKIANHLVAESVAQACASHDCKLVHISTDHLFEGDKARATEASIPAPVNTYAIHKLAAEKAVLDACPTALVVRTTFFGWGPSYRRSFSDQIIDAFESNRSIQSFDDVFFSPLSTNRLIDLSHAVIQRGFVGRLHIGCGERVSKYAFTVKLAKACGYDANLIQPIQAARLRSKVKRPLDLSLSTKLLEEFLGTKPITIDEVLCDLVNDHGRRDEIKRIGTVIPYGKHYIDDDDIGAVIRSLKSGSLTQGPAIPAFEKRIADYVDARYAVAVSSATAGLHIVYKALGLNSSGSVLTSPITFVSTANAAVFCGGKARFSDIDRGTVNLDWRKVEEAISTHQDIVIVTPVIFGGATDGIPEVCVTSRAAGKFVVEDAAHGLGASYHCGAMVGSCKYSDCTVFSLHPVKSIAAGEGGVITTNNEGIYSKLLRLRSHGINKNDDPFLMSDRAFTDGIPNPWYYEMQEVGYHYRNTDIQISLASSQLDKIDHFLKRRRELVLRYREWSETLPFLSHAQAIDPYRSANHLFVAKIDFGAIGHNRNSFMRALRKKNIITQVHYIPVVMQPFYDGLGCSIDEYPEAGLFYENALSLPLYFGLEDAELSFVMKEIERLSKGG